MLLLDWLITALVSNPHSANPWYILTLVSAIAFLGGSCLTAGLSLAHIADNAEGYPAKLLASGAIALEVSGIIVMLSVMATFDDVVMPGPLFAAPLLFPFLLYLPLSSPGRKATRQLLVELIERVKTTE